MPTIRIDLYHDPKKPWKLGEASLIFTDADGPLLSGLTLRGFTIGTTSVPGADFNITVPGRSYEAQYVDDVTHAVTTKRAMFSYLVPTDRSHREPYNALLQQIGEAYRNIKALVAEDSHKVDPPHHDPGED